MNLRDGGAEAPLLRGVLKGDEGAVAKRSDEGGQRLDLVDGFEGEAKGTGDRLGPEGGGAEGEDDRPAGRGAGESGRGAFRKGAAGITDDGGAVAPEGGVKSGGDVTITNGTITVNDDSHSHVIANVDGLQTALNAKAPLASPTFTGTPKAPTAAAGTNTTQLATTAFVQAAVDSKIAAADAMRFRGTLGTGGTITALPASHKVGDSYKVITAGTYAGQKCEVGDMVVCTTTGTTATDAHWTVIQANVDGAVTGPATSVDSHVAVFSGTTGKVIEDSGFTIGKSVPADAKFTDTTYNPATTSAAGLMSAADKSDFDSLKTACQGKATDATVTRDSQTITVELQSVFYGQGDGFYTDPQSINIPYVSSQGAGLLTTTMFARFNRIADGATADSALTEADIDAAIAAAS